MILKLLRNWRGIPTGVVFLNLSVQFTMNSIVDCWVATSYCWRTVNYFSWKILAFSKHLICLKWTIFLGMILFMFQALSCFRAWTSVFSKVSPVKEQPLRYIWQCVSLPKLAGLIFLCFLTLSFPFLCLPPFFIFLFFSLFLASFSLAKGPALSHRVLRWRLSHMGVQKGKGGSDFLAANSGSVSMSRIKEHRLDGDRKPLF